ncbi:hypothetical protein D3C81_1841030 [compost metagenome]
MFNAIPVKLEDFWMVLAGKRNGPHRYLDAQGKLQSANGKEVWLPVGNVFQHRFHYWRIKRFIAPQ